MVIAVTIDELETFVSIARRGGFARAAESRRRSQPATRFAGMLRQFGQRHPFREARHADREQSEAIDGFAGEIGEALIF